MVIPWTTGQPRRQLVLQQPKPAPTRAIEHNSSPKASNPGGLHMRVPRRILMLALSALLAALSLAFAGTASAQTSVQASVTATDTPHGPCSTGASLCGTANIAGYGAASWNIFVTGVTPVVSPCGSSYTAATYFTLVSDSGSTLVLDEGGSLCGLGHDGAAYRADFRSAGFGHPFDFVGSWTVDPASTGQFLGLSGSGTDLVQVAGAHVAGTYSGALG